MENKLFDDEKYVDNSLDLKIVDDILDMMAYLMTPKSKLDITKDIRYIDYSYKKAVVERHVDYCVENNLLMSSQKTLNNGDSKDVYYLSVEAQLNRLYDISKDKYRKNKVIRCKLAQNNMYYSLIELRDAVFNHFNGQHTYFIWASSQGGRW